MSGWIVSTLVASSALMLLVLALRRPVAQHFGARAAYALWLLPVLRMVLPPLPEAVTPVARALPVHIDIAALLAALPSAPDTGRASAIATAPAIDWWPLLLAIWLGVAAVRFALPWIAYRRFMAGALAGGRRLDAARGVAVHISGRLAGPLAAGVFARRIVLPRDFHIRFDPTEQRLALAHEAAHHARGDTIANAVALLVLALHWWNPIAHVAWRAFRSDQELACDATVLRGASPEERHAYGSALLKAAFGGTPAAACGMARAAELKHRLRMMAASGRGAMRSAAGGWLAAALVAGGLIGTATGGAAAEQVRAFGDKVRRSLPVPPIPPVAPYPSAVPELSMTAPHVVIDGKRYLPAPDAPTAPDAPRIIRDDIPYVAESLPPIPPMPPMPPMPAAPPHPHALSAAERAEMEGVVAQAHAEIDRLDVPRLIETSMAAARAELSASCAERGIRVRADERDWAALAMCDRQAIKRQIGEALREARREIAAAKLEVAAAQRERIMAKLDREIARVEDGR